MIPRSRAHFTNAFLHRNSIPMQVPFCFHLSYSKVIASEFCTWHDNCVFVACARFCSDMVPCNGVTPDQFTNEFGLRWKIFREMDSRRNAGNCQNYPFLSAFYWAMKFPQLLNTTGSGISIRMCSSTGCWNYPELNITILWRCNFYGNIFNSMTLS